MPVTELSAVLAQSAADVFETMFFTAVVGEADPASVPQPQWISACLTFHGQPSGQFCISAPPDTGRKLAANFLGADEGEVTEAQSAQVLCELCNMLCGSVLSRVEKDVLFDLTSPQPCQAGSGEDLPIAAIVQLEEGPVAMRMRFDP